jgi:type IX secretion system PorP/SprF family membrane protein
MLNLEPLPLLNNPEMKKTLILLTIIASTQLTAQQDPHFSMWYSSPSLLNAGATGTMEQDISFFTNYRGQWLSGLPGQVRTNAFSGEMKLGNQSMRSGWVGVGAHYANDATGDAKIMSNIVSIPVSYVWEGYEKTYFSMGIKPGIINRSINMDVATWDNQWNGIAFDNTILPQESGPNKKTQFDIGAGIYFKKLYRNNSKIDIGFAANHLNAPDQGFKTLNFQTFRQYIFHTSGSIRLERYKFLLSPQLIALFQGPHRDIIVGTSFDILLNPGSLRTTFVQEKSVSFGLNYRVQDALIASFMLKLNGFQVGLSYDALLNTNRIPSRTVGAVEIFLKYSFFKEQRKRFIR